MPIPQRPRLHRNPSAPALTLLASPCNTSEAPPPAAPAHGIIFTRLCIRRVSILSYPLPSPLPPTDVPQIPEPFIEPTSTLLLISPECRFIDVRVARDDTSLLLVASIGTCALTRDVAAFVHTLHLRPTPVPCRTLAATETLANADVLHRHDGYEEIWRPAEIEPPPLCIVLELKQIANPTGDWRRAPEDCRGLVVRIGRWCQGMVKGRRDAAPTVERWRLGDKGWERVSRVGKEVLPCAVACMDQDESPDGRFQGGRYWKKALGTNLVVNKVVRKGERVFLGRTQWEVVERSEW